MLQKINKDFAIFRDDNYPFLGGGNKARKMMSLHKEIKSKKYNAIVTTGGIQSNHCRATALYCHKYNIDCTIVFHGNKKDFYTQSGNAKIVKNTPSNIVFSEPDKISDNMDDIILDYKKKGLKPYYLYGGGHTLEGSIAYVDIVQELIDFNYIPDYIFLASGTGSTQAGLLNGIAELKLNSKIVGISVGRSKENAEKVISEFSKELSRNYDLSNKIGKIEVDDTFLCGGYGKYNKDIESISKSSLIDYGVFLDTTYTAKAFYGMKKYIQKKSIKGKILFWYTGGIYNYLAE